MEAFHRSLDMLNSERPPTMAGRRGQDEMNSLALVANRSDALHHEADNTTWVPSRPTCSQTGLHTRTLARAGNDAALRPSCRTSMNEKNHSVAVPGRQPPATKERRGKDEMNSLSLLASRSCALHHEVSPRSFISCWIVELAVVRKDFSLNYVIPSICFDVVSVAAYCTLSRFCRVKRWWINNVLMSIFSFVCAICLCSFIDTNYSSLFHNVFLTRNTWNYLD